MRRSLFILLTIIISSYSFSQENTRINNLQHEINILNERIDSLKSEIQDEILKNGYSIIAKSRYSYNRSNIKLKAGEYGTAFDTIPNGETIVIIDKTISCFKVLYKGKTGFIDSYEIDLTDYPAINFLEATNSREKKESNSNYSTSAGGSVKVKGYYRKDGTYVRPHTRSAPRSSGGRRR